MFVSLFSSSGASPAQAQPLPPHCTLKQSSSCITVNSYTLHDTPEPADEPCSPQGGRAWRLLKDELQHSPRSPLQKEEQHVKEKRADSLLPEYSNARTRGQFKPQRANKGTTSYQLRQFAEATLGSGSLRKAVVLPEGEDLNEWLAVNVVDFYNQINLLYGSITEFCSPITCPEMKATDEFEYLWQDAATGYPKPTKMSAPEYIEHLMTWTQSLIDNESIFPSRIGAPFPKHFQSTIKQMFKRLYRVYAHIYCHHYPVIVHLGLEPHLNTSFKHYVLFVDEFGLEKGGGKDFWGPLGDLVDSMLKSD
ncbi:Mitotic exit network component [Lithohypha guttulata]|uniref:Mitotic exit network component n=1 Tax=Lithohypha guttulata TaxID=1690604 RepID=UPI002DDE1C7C|nr:Mitotic exit network component [Lithohypha guttulata]KAK5106885.1 Mitotic exit network component [Lithohypha guttulata]